MWFSLVLLELGLSSSYTCLVPNNEWGDNLLTFDRIQRHLERCSGYAWKAVTSSIHLLGLIGNDRESPDCKWAKRSDKSVSCVTRQYLPGPYTGLCIKRIVSWSAYCPADSLLVLLLSFSIWSCLLQNQMKNKAMAVQWSNQHQEHPLGYKKYISWTSLPVEWTYGLL